MLMKAECKVSSGYALTEGKQYDILEIQEGMFQYPYAIFLDNNGKETACYYWRFDIPENVAKAEAKANAERYAARRALENSEDQA